MKTVADALREEGFDLGFEKGRKMERERSEKIESELRKEIIIIVQNLLGKNMSIESIHEITEIPVNKILEIQKKIDK